MRIAYLTAGAAGMYCGSCMHDNALARALIAEGHECLLLPVYTPIRTDEVDVSTENVFFGGINVYLQQKLPWVGRLPRPLVRWLDTPWVLRLATRRAASTQASLLGDLTVSMLQGSHGRQASEVLRLADWMKQKFHPDVVILTNLLIGGCIPDLRAATGAKVGVWLQGDDIFLDHLLPRHREEATKLMSELGKEVDHFLVNSHFYADKMSQRLGIDRDRFVVLPLAIDIHDLAPRPTASDSSAGSSDSTSETSVPRIGYFARLAPEKGFHVAVEAFIQLSKQLGPGSVQFHYGGWLGKQNEAYFSETVQQLDRAGLTPFHFHHGSPNRSEKASLLRSFDLFSVPTVYEEPKGLFVLEALASGVPVVQPDHGAFPELLASSGGGVLVTPEDPSALASEWLRLITDQSARQQLGQEGYQGVHARHTIRQQAAQLAAILEGRVQPVLNC